MLSTTYETSPEYLSETVPKTDSKSIVTPFAFEIAPQVLYIPLATPTKRGLAMIVDALLISVLAEQAGWLFILLVGLTLLIQKKSHKLGKIFKWGLYIFMLVMMIWVTIEGFISSDLDDSSPKSNISNMSENTAVVGQFISYVPNFIRLSNCENFDCAEMELNDLIPALSQLQLPVSEQASILNDAIDDVFLSETDKVKLKHKIAQELEVLKRGEVNVTEESQQNQASVTKEAKLKPSQGLEPSTTNEIETRSQELQDQNLPETTLELQEFTSSDENTHLQELDQEDNKVDDYSLISWVKGILNDLGLGFGWAAFYFTVFTAWFDGQTLGKKLLRIRVIQLDGAKLSLWGSFGRYGGYGAGFATGLLGFLQIFWDSNRQAIQDKISATVVIDIKENGVLAKKP